MVQILPQQGETSSRLGASIGRGLADQVPKELDRYRLSSGLKKLASNSDLSPAEKAAEMYGLPGGTDVASQFLPFLIQQQQKDAFLKKGSTSSGKPTGEKQEGVSTTPTSISQQTGNTSPAFTYKPGEFVPKEELFRYKQSLQKQPTFDDIKKLADEYLVNNITQDRDEAMRLAGQEVNQNLAAQNANQQQTRQDLNNRFALQLQGGGLGNFKHVAGEVQQAAVDQAEYLVNELGYSPEAASQEVGDVLQKLGQVATQTQAAGSISNLLAGKGEKISALRNQKKQFDKYGFGDIFDDIAASSLRIDPMKAAGILNNVENKEFQSTLKSTRDKGFKKGIRIKMSLPELAYDKLASTIRPQDNILSLANEIRDKGYSPEDFMQAVRDLNVQEKIALTPSQMKQINKTISDIPSFGDMLFDVFTRK